MAEGALMLLGDAPAHLEPDPEEARLRGLLAHRTGVVRVYMATSGDGLAVGPDGSARDLLGPDALRVRTVLRALADVVVVGGQAARRERYADIVLPEPLAATRAAAGLRPHVDVAVVTHGGVLPPGLTPARTWVLTHAGSPATTRLGPEWASRIVLAGPDDVSPRTALRELATHGLSRALCEGGPTLVGRLAGRRVVDDWVAATSAVLGRPRGAAVPAPPPELRPALELAGDDAVVRRWAR